MAEVIEKPLENVIDFSLLSGMNIPPIKVEGTKIETDEEELKPEIREVESINSLQKEEEEEDVTPADDITPNKDDQEEDSIKVIASWANDLGIIELDEEAYSKAEDKEEYFKQKFAEQVKKEATNYLSDEMKEINEKYEAGVDLADYFSSKGREASYNDVTEEDLKDTNLQKELVSNWLEVSDYTKEEIKEKLSDYTESLLLEKEAKLALKKLVKHEQTYQDSLEKQAKTTEQKNRETYEKSISDLKKSITDANEFIPNVPMKKEDKGKLFDGIVKRGKDGRTELERRMQDPLMAKKVAQFVLLLDGELGVVERKLGTKIAKKAAETVNTYKEETNKKLDLSVVRSAVKSLKRTKI